MTRGDQQITRPELSPDGTRFVIRIQRRTQDDIVVVQRDGTNWRDVTNDKFFDRYPRWSPDGKRIAFASDRSGRYEIWTIDADGTNLRQHSFDSPGSSSFPAWSPDGTRIVFRRHDVNVIIEVNKGWQEQTPQQLPAPEKPFVVWDWSPDGKKLLGTFSDSSVGYFSFDTNRYERVANFGAYPVWMPDSSRYIAFSQNKIHVGNIVTKQSSEIFPVRDTQIRNVGISRDGQLIYFSAQSTESNIWLLDLE
jgi:Tol biopolymer transport system component